VIDGAPLAGSMRRAIPGLKLMRWLRWLDLRLELGIMRLPDALIFLDVAPETALARLRAGGKPLDRHENIHDLASAQAMYRGVAELFARHCGARSDSSRP
jgi:thymidylate kinase